jgi:hypothetical protein
MVAVEYLNLGIVIPASLRAPLLYRNSEPRRKLAINRGIVKQRRSAYVATINAGITLPREPEIRAAST